MVVSYHYTVLMTCPFFFSNFHLSLSPGFNEVGYHQEAGWAKLPQTSDIFQHLAGPK